jgi:WD40 repeat protein
MASNLLRNLEADDIFISYSRDDGEAYLTGLDAALSKLGFSCFSDKRGTEADRLPPETLFRKVRLCKTLVLLGTPGAISEPQYVTQEVVEFTKANGTARIIAVSFDRDAEFTDWSEMPWYEYVQGKSRERELPEAMKTGEPSVSVVKNIEAASNYMKSKDRLRMYRNRAFLAFVLLSAAGLGAALFGLYELREVGRAAERVNKARTDADDAIARSQERVRKGEEQAQKDIRQAQENAQTIIRQAQEEGRTKISEAEELTEAADKKRAAAERRTREAEILRRQADAAAEEQKGIATARRLANRAESLRSESADLLTASALVAAESLRRVPTLEADQAARRALALLPRPAALLPHKGYVRHNVFSNDGKYLVTSSGHDVFVWEADSHTSRTPPLAAKPLATLPHGSYINSVVFSPDGKYLITTATDNRARVWADWSSPAPREVSTLQHGRAEVSDVAISPNGTYLATVAERKVHLWADWQTASPKPLWSSEEVTGSWPERVAFTADESHLVGKLILVAGQPYKEKRQVWQVADGKDVTARFAPPARDTGPAQQDTTYPPDVVLTRDRKFFVEFHDDNSVRIVRLPFGPEVARIANVKLPASPAKIEYDRLDFSPLSGFFALTDGGTVSVIDTRQAKPVFLQGAVYSGLYGAAVLFSPDGKSLVILTRLDVHRTAVQFWSLSETPARPGRPPGASEVLRIVPEQGAHAISFSPDGKYLATGGAKHAQVWETKAVEGFTALPQKAEVSAVVFSPDGHHFANGNREGEVRVRRTHGLQEVEPVPFKPAPRGRHRIEHLAVSRDGNYLAVATADVVEVFANWTTKPSRVGWVKPEGELLSAVAFDPSGVYLATVGFKPASLQRGGPNDKKQVRLWRGWDKGEARAVEQAHPANAVAAVPSVAFSPSGEYMLTGGGDGSVRIWRDWDKRRPREFPSGIACPLAEGEAFEARTAGDSGAATLALSRDGRFLALTCGVFGKNVVDIDLYRVFTMVFEGWESRRPRLVLKAYDRLVAPGGFDRAGEYLALAGRDFASVWDLRNGNEVTRVTHHYSSSQTLAYALSADSSLLVTGAYDNTARAWRWRPNVLRELVCQRVAGLPAEDWSMYLPGEPPPQTCPNTGRH